MPSELTQVPHVGPKTAADLQRIGITAIDELRGQDPDLLFERLCATEGVHDICSRDVFASAIHYAETGRSRAWWLFSRDRLAGAAARST
jgi:hypothetical protein